MKCTKEKLEKKNGQTKRREAVKGGKSQNERRTFSLALSISLSLAGSNNNNGQTRVYAYVGNLQECVGERWQGTGYKLQLSGYFVLQ